MWRMLVARPHHPRLLEARGCPARYTTSGGREQRGRVLTEAAEAGGPWHGRWQQYLSTVASSSSKYAAAPPGQPLAAQQPDKQHSKVRGNSWSPPSHHHHKRRSTRRFVITEKAPTRAFSWLKAATTAFTFKTLLRHYAKRALTPRSLNVKLGPRRKGHKGQAVWLA